MYRRQTDFVPDSMDGEAVQEPQDFSHLGWTDSTGRRVFFSAGSEETDPLAESLARALRGVPNEETIEETTYKEDLDRADPLFCPGKQFFKKGNVRFMSLHKMPSTAMILLPKN